MTQIGRLDSAGLDSALTERLGRGPRVAVVHDWLVTYAGAERVLEQILMLFPNADVFTLLDLLPPGERDFLRGARVHTSFIQKLPVLRRRHRATLPLMPLAVEQFDLSGYDLVISSSHAVAKGVITGPEQLHVSYCHSPMRYAWDLQHQYLRESGVRGLRGWLARWFLHQLRIWDIRTSYGVDAFIANSRFVARRVRKTYNRHARVIYPPVNVHRFELRERKDDYYLTASRMVPYKRIPLIVEAFSATPERRLIVIGEGPEMSRVQRVAGSNVQVMGWQPGDVLRDYMQRARAFVFAAEEDFGIAPVEAQACGTPVIAYAGGGVRESVIADVTGVFFESQEVDAILEAVARFESARGGFCPRTIRRNAEEFAEEQFRDQFARFVIKRWNRARTAPGAPVPRRTLDSAA